MPNGNSLLFSFRDKKSLISIVYNRKNSQLDKPSKMKIIVFNLMTSKFNSDISWLKTINMAVHNQLQAHD